MFLSLSSSRWPPTLLGNESPKSAFVDPISSSKTGAENHLRPTSTDRRRTDSISTSTPTASQTIRHRTLPPNGALEPEVLSDRQLAKRARKQDGVSADKRSPGVPEVWSEAAVVSRHGASHRQQVATETTDSESSSKLVIPTIFPVFGHARNHDNNASSHNVGDVRDDIGRRPVTSLSQSVTSHSTASDWRQLSVRNAVDDHGASGSRNINAGTDGYSLSPLANLLTSLVATSSTTSTTSKWQFPAPSSMPSLHSLPISPSRPWLDPAPWYHLFPGGSTAAQRHLLQVAVAAAASAAAATSKTWQPLLGSDNTAAPLHIRDIATRGISSTSSSSSAAAMAHAHQPVPGMNGMAKRLFGCPQCRYLTDRKNNLKRHVTTMHQESAGKTLECCAVQFRSKAALRDHVTIFHGAGYTCRHCARNFCRKALLKRHLAVHSGQKDYTCSRCDYATSHKSNLERHKKVHERIPHQTNANGNGGQEMESSDDGCDGDVNDHRGSTIESEDRAIYRRRAFPSDQHPSTRSMFDGVSFSHHLNRHLDVRADDVTPEADVQAAGQGETNTDHISATNRNSAMAMFGGLGSASALPGNRWHQSSRRAHDNDRRHHHHQLHQHPLSISHHNLHHSHLSNRDRQQGNASRMDHFHRQADSSRHGAARNNMPISSHSPGGSSSITSSSSSSEGDKTHEQYETSLPNGSKKNDFRDVNSEDDNITVGGNDVIADDEDDEEINVVDDLVS